MKTINKKNTDCSQNSINNMYSETGSFGRGGGGGGEGKVVEGNLAIIVVPTPCTYLTFEKKMDPFIYLIVQNVDHFISCPKIFHTHLLLLVRQMSQLIH